MVAKPTFNEFVMAVAKRSMMTWHGGEGWFALAGYFSILLLPFLATGVIADILGEAISKLLALIATIWLVVLFFVVTPFKMWQEERYRINLMEDAGQPRIHLAWRFNARKKNAEIIITNVSTKTIYDYELKFRNFRSADGTNVYEALTSLPTVDDKKPPISLHPLDPQYFEFAQLKYSGGSGTIAILPNTDSEKWMGAECGVKLSSTGKDIISSKIELRLRVNGDSISIDSWQAGEKAVAIEDGEV